MILAAVLAVLGVVVIALSAWWMTAAGFTVAGILSAAGVAVGGALIVAAWALVADKISPTSRKL